MALKFLSGEWIEALDVAARQWEGPAGVRFTVQQAVGDVRYSIVLDGGAVRVRPGQSASPDITLTQTYDVAVRIHRGEFNAQRALAAGQLKISGNVELLARHARILSSLEDVFAPVRAETVYDASIPTSRLDRSG